MPLPPSSAPESPCPPPEPLLPYPYPGPLYNGHNYPLWIDHLTRTLVTAGLYGLAFGNDHECLPLRLEFYGASYRLGHRRRKSSTSPAPSSPQSQHNYNLLPNSSVQREAAKGGLIGSVIALREEEDDEADEDGVEFGVGDGNGEDEDADELKLFQMQHERVELLIRTILGSMEERIRLVYAGEFAAGACMKIWLQQPDVLLRWVRDDWIRRRGVLEEISKRGRGGE